jgi:hypothetical protein
MRRLGWAALLGSLLLLAVVLASAFAGGCRPSQEDIDSGYYYGGYWNDTGEDCH